MPRKSRTTNTSTKKANKPWFKKTGPYAYAVNSRTKNKTFLVVCEGQTEALYFSSFPVVTATIRSVKTGTSKTALVESIDKYRRGGSYDEIWCVFDYDLDPANHLHNEDFNRAIEMAISRNYHCAYSNDSFELWLVLHYQYMDLQMHRKYYCDVLGSAWGINYDREGKTAKFARNIYQHLNADSKASQKKAINYARRLLSMHESKPYHLQNPVTTVFQLVEQLNAHCRK
jgi:predicted DNA-binding WGR domain protein